MGAVGSIIGAGTDLITTGADIWSTANQNKKQRAWNEKQSKIAYDRDLEMWNKSNTYNSPSAQIERFKQAGLNTNLMYGQGSAGLASSSAPSYNAPEGQFKLPSIKSSLLPMIGQYQDIQNTSQQRDNLKAQEQFTRTQNDLALINLAQKQAEQPYFEDNAHAMAYQKYMGGESAYWGTRNKYWDAQSKKFLWDSGFQEKQLKGMDIVNQTKAQQLLNYNLDGAILKQRKDLNQMDIDIRKSIGGLKTTDITGGFNAMRNIAGLFKKTGSKIPKYSSLTKKIVKK